MPDKWIWSDESRQAYCSPAGQPTTNIVPGLTTTQVLIGIGCLQRIADALEVIANPPEYEARKQEAEVIKKNGEMLDQKQEYLLPASQHLHRRLLELLQPKSQPHRQAVRCFEEKVIKMWGEIENEEQAVGVLEWIDELTIQKCLQVVENGLMDGAKKTKANFLSLPALQPMAAKD